MLCGLFLDCQHGCEQYCMYSLSQYKFFYCCHRLVFIVHISQKYKLRTVIRTKGKDLSQYSSHLICYFLLSGLNIFFSWISNLLFFDFAICSSLDQVSPPFWISYLLFLWLSQLLLTGLVIFSSLAYLSSPSWICYLLHLGLIICSFSAKLSSPSQISSLFFLAQLSSPSWISYLLLPGLVVYSFLAQLSIYSFLDQFSPPPQSSYLLFLYLVISSSLAQFFLLFTKLSPPA